MYGEQITDISSQSKYYSFLLVTTESKEIAEKWDHYILSVDGKLLMNADQPQTPDQPPSYNIGVDTFACTFEDIPGPRFVLTESKWLDKCLSFEQKERLKSNGFLNYKGLPMANLINFYYYVQTPIQLKSDAIQKMSSKFVRIDPRFFLSCGCLVFEITIQQNVLVPDISTHFMNNSKEAQAQKEIRSIHDLIQFKSIPRMNRVSSGHGKPYTFTSQYSLLSDIHFLNCLVRGRSSIAYYVKQGEFYEFQVNEEVRKLLRKLHVQSKL